MPSSSTAATPEGALGRPGIPLRSYTGHVFRFDPGALCLELLVTGGPGALTRYEVLHTPEDLAAWVGRSRLAPTPSTLELTDADVEHVRRLRDALLRTVVSRLHAGGLPQLGIPPAGPADLHVINDAAARPSLAPALGEDGTRRWSPHPASGTQLASTVARDAVDLLTGPDAERIRMCSGDRCYLIYVDASRPGRRRWCSMEHCGNRSKVRAHRARRTREPAPKEE